MTYCKRRPTPLSAKSTSHHRLCGASTARLELLARPTRTRIIAASSHRGFSDGGLLHGLLESRLGGRCSRRLGVICLSFVRAEVSLGTEQIFLHKVTREGGEELLESLEIGRATEEVVHDLVLDALHELHEHGVGLGLVLGERILLAVGAEVDGLAKAVHGVEVLLPEAVDGIQNDILLETRAGGFILDCGLAVVSLDECLRQPLAVLFDLAGLEGALLLGKSHGEGGIDPLEKSCDIRLGITALGREEGGDLLRHDFINDFVDENARILRIHDLVAIAVDDLALLVHDIIELKGAATHEVVPLLDALLGCLDALV